MLCGGAMHPIGFQLKRAHLSAVGAGRRLLQDVPDMTPARFDILYLIHKTPRLMRSFGYKADQVTIVQRLGLSRATISRMLKRLEELGLVTRERCHNDARRKLVTLTEAGIQRIRAALHIVFTGCEMIRAYTSMWKGRRSRRNRCWLHHNLAELFNSIYDVAQLFNDTSEPLYMLNYEIDH